jgi:hypothetical protein
VVDPVVVGGETVVDAPQHCLACSPIRRLRPQRSHRARYGLVGDIGQHEVIWLMAYVRGSEGIIVSLAERIG